MLNRKITILGAELKSVPYFNTELIKLTNTRIYEIPFETVPTIGKKHNYKTCKECLKNYKKLLADFTKKYNGKGSNKAFPYCCTEHSLLSDLPLFKKSDYDKVPKITADKVIFTWNHIINNIDNTDFYNDITDYIEYTATSFGQLPNESESLFFSAYIKNITHFLKTNLAKNINYQIILDFINENYTEAKLTNTEKKNNLESLLKTYEDWFNLFPFEISFFSDIKIYFERQMPLVRELHYNKYLDQSRGKAHTRSSLIYFLMEITNNLLSKINCLSLQEKGLLTKPEEIKFELIISERKLKLNRGYLLDSDDEKRKFEDMLNEWFTDEKKFIDEVTPLLKTLPQQPIVKRKPELNEKLITFKNSETIEKIHSELKGYFSNKEAELLKALQGQPLNEILLFPHNQNKFVELFRRLKYNGFLLNTDTETKNWICTTFQFLKNGFAEPQPFNESSVWDNLNKGKGEPTKKQRICITDWLPYKSPLQLKMETENEKL